MPKKSGTFAGLLKNNPQVALAGAISGLLFLLFSGVVILNRTGESQLITPQAATCAGGGTLITKKVCQGNQNISCDRVPTGEDAIIRLPGTNESVPITTDNMCLAWTDPPNATCITKSECQCSNIGEYYCGAQGSCTAGCRNTGGLTCSQWLDKNCSEQPTSTPTSGQVTTAPVTPISLPTATPVICGAVPTQPQNLQPSGSINSGEYFVYWSKVSLATAYLSAWDNLYNPEGTSDTWEGCGIHGDYCVPTQNFWLDGPHYDSSVGTGSFEFTSGSAYRWFVYPYNNCGEQGAIGQALVYVPSQSCNAFCTINENCAGLGSSFACINNVCRNTQCSNDTDCICNAAVTPAANCTTYSPISSVSPTGISQPTVSSTTSWVGGPTTASKYKIKVTETLNGTTRTLVQCGGSSPACTNITFDTSGRVPIGYFAHASFTFKAGGTYQTTVSLVDSCTGGATSTLLVPTITTTGSPPILSTPTNTPIVSKAPEGNLPQAGNSLPTLALVSVGMMFVLLGIFGWLV